MDLGKKMKEITKETTIKFLKNLNADKDKMNNVINFLKMGWKYEEMWEELFNTYPCCSIDDGLSIQLMLGSAMGIIEQKYKVVK